MKPKCAAWLLLGLVAVATACGSAPQATVGASPVDQNPQLLAGGVLRVAWAQTSVADLTIRQMTAVDVVSPPIVAEMQAGQPVPSCVRAAVGAEPEFFDLNWRSVRNFTALPAVRLTLRTPQGSPLLAFRVDGSCQPVTNLDVGPLADGNGEQLVLQLFAPYGTRLRYLQVEIAGRGARLPLVHACPASDPRSNCAIDPVTFDHASPWSVSLTA